MKTESQLKLQAYLDGELTEQDARQVKTWAEQDAEARALLAQLGQTQGWLKGNEPVVTLPESREFYWSKIEREIVRAEKAADRAAAQTAAPWWRRYWAPLCGASAVAALMIMTVNPRTLGHLGAEEFDNPLEEAS